MRSRGSEEREALPRSSAACSSRPARGRGTSGTSRSATAASAWLAEAQGGFWIMPPLEAPPVPEWNEPRARRTLDFGGYGRFAAVEVSEATYVSAEGDLPFARAGSPSSGTRTSRRPTAARRRSTTATDAGLDAFYVGHKVELADARDRGPHGVEGPQGVREGGGAELPELRRRARAQGPREHASASPALLRLDPRRRRARAVRPTSSRSSRSSPPFRSSPWSRRGPRGRPTATRTSVLGAVQKEATSDGTTYLWVEYLLKDEKSEAFHWLAESNGALHAARARARRPPSRRSDRYATFKGARYRIFSRARASVAPSSASSTGPSKKRRADRRDRLRRASADALRAVREAEIRVDRRRRTSRSDESRPPSGRRTSRQPTASARPALAARGTSRLLVEDGADPRASPRSSSSPPRRSPRPERVVFDRTYDLVDPARMLYAERGSPAAAAGWSPAVGAAPARPGPSQTRSPRARRARRRRGGRSA